MSFVQNPDEKELSKAEGMGGAEGRGAGGYSLPGEQARGFLGGAEARRSWGKGVPGHPQAQAGSLPMVRGTRQ